MRTLRAVGVVMGDATKRINAATALFMSWFGPRKSPTPRRIRYGMDFAPLHSGYSGTPDVYAETRAKKQAKRIAMRQKRIERRRRRASGFAWREAQRELLKAGGLLK